MNWRTRNSPLRRWAFLVAAPLALAGCDEGTDLNIDLPDTTAISTAYEDLPLEVATVRLAPVPTLKADHFLVGRLADNVAGTTEARAYFNVVSFAVADSLPSRLTAPELDSVVLVMGFDKVFGSATTPVKFDVYTLPAPLDERQVYDGGTVTALGPALGQNLTSRLDRTRQVTTPASGTTPASTTTMPDPNVRLLLQRSAAPAVSSPFAEQLFAQLKQPNFDQARLDALLKGLAVVPSAGHTSSILSFGRTYASRLAVYFHAGAARRSYSAYFGPVYSSSASASPASDPRYYTQISNTLPAGLAALATRPGAVPAAALSGTSYVQEGTGLGTRLTFTGLGTLMNTPGLTINRAELRVPVKPFTNVLFPNPSLLYAVEVDGNNGVLERTANFTPRERVVQEDGANPLGTGQPALGVLIDPVTNQSYYSMPITNYLQAYLNNKLEGNPAALVLLPTIRTSRALSLNRAALDANNIRLRVYYSTKP